MAATTVVTDDATIISETDTADRWGRSSFSWGAALIGAAIAAAVTFLLITLGSGVGLALTTTPKLLHGGAPAFLTLGAIYFFVAQAFGFVVGGHVTGRLIGPAVETPKEEEFRAGAHGLGVWAIAVVATATMAAIAAFVAEGAAPAALGAFTTAKTDSDLTPLATGYWVDTLFRGAPQVQASLDGAKFAQNSSNTANDAEQPQAQSQQPAASPPQAQQVTPGTDDESSGAQSITPQDTVISPTTSGATQPAPMTNAPTSVAGRNVAADKVEAGRILDVGMANGGTLTAEDRTQLAQLVSLDTAMTFPASQRRVDDVEARIRADEVKTAETARKVTMYAALWAALALLFGAIVSVMAAISARWEDDRISLFGH